MSIQLTEKETQEVLDYINILRTSSFIGWSKEEINGYTTACISIEMKIKGILKNKEKKKICPLCKKKELDKYQTVCSACENDERN